MKFLSWEQLFGPDYIQKRRNNLRSLKSAVWHTLAEDTNFNGISYAAGSQYKFWETENFGWVFFHPSSRTPGGNIPGKFAHKY